MSAECNDSPNFDTSNPTKEFLPNERKSGPSASTNTPESPHENSDNGPSSASPYAGAESASAAVEGPPDVPDDVLDTHSCGKCKLSFNSLQAYIQHKLSKDNCKVTYTKGKRRVLIPHLVIKPEKVDKEENAVATSGESSGKKSKRGRPVGSRSKHGANDILDTNIIDSSQRYKCDMCERTFIREAALRRHKDYDHKCDSESGEEDGSVAETDGAALDAYSPGRPMLKRVKIEPQVVMPSAYIPMATVTEPTVDEGDVPIIGHIALGCALGGVRQKLVPGEVWSGDELRPYGCHDCGKTFKEAGVLRAHKLTHSNEREFVCPEENCTFAFKTKGSLKRHLRRHTGDRPFKCDHCGRGFGESGALTRHLKSKTSCTEKTDADLPRYGKKVGLDQDIPAARAGREMKTLQEQQQLEPALELSLVDKEDSANQILMQEVLPDETYIKVVQLGGTETVQHVPAQAQIVVETNGIDGDPGMEEIIQAKTEVCAKEQDGLNSYYEEGRQDDPGSDRVVILELDEHAAAATATASEVEDEPVLVQLEVEEHCCLVCQALCTDRQALTEHLKTHLNQTPYRCTFCKYSAARAEDLELHLQITHQSRFRAEDDSEGELDHGSILQQVVQQIREQQEQQHQQQSQEDTEEHSRQATIALQQLLTLQQAESASDSGDASSDHGKLSSGGVKKPAVHACPVCHRAFRASAYLALHMRSHTGERPHKCPTCGKSFMSRDTLTKHVSSHSDERNFKCGECGKLFKRISHVREHLKVHSTERPFPCTLCDKSFKSANACKVHLRTHTDLLPHHCNMCNRKFRERSSLERHMRTHTGEKPFKCQHCGRCFSEHGTLNRHYKAKVPCTKQLQLLRSVAGQQLTTYSPITMSPITHQSLSTEVGVQIGNTVSQQAEAADQLDMQSQAAAIKKETSKQLQPSDGVKRLQTTQPAPAVQQGVPQQLQVMSEIMAESGPEQVHQEISSVLAEFSSVVTDTQQYIIADGSMESTEQAPEECVILTEEEPVEKIEIITQEPSGSNQMTEIHDTEYILLSQEGDKITVLNQHTGETLEMQSSDMIIQNVEQEGQVVTLEMDSDGMGDETVHSVIMGESVVEETVEEDIQVEHSAPNIS